MADVGNIPSDRVDVAASAVADGAVVYGDGTGLTGDTAFLKADHANKRLGIGAVPSERLHVKNATGSAYARIEGTSLGGINLRSTSFTATIQMEESAGGPLGFACTGGFHFTGSARINGSLRIGDTTAPTDPLEVFHSSRAAIILNTAVRTAKIVLPNAGANGGIVEFIPNTAAGGWQWGTPEGTTTPLMALNSSGLALGVQTASYNVDVRGGTDTRISAKAVGASGVASLYLRTDFRSARIALDDNAGKLTFTEALGYEYTGFIRANQGSGAATPDISFGNDPDTGIYAIGAEPNVLGFAIGAQIGAKLSEPTDGNTALLIRRNVGGTLSLQQVSMGAADSGGAGFKVLRVPN